ncbi:MAG: addiction module antitoxin [Vulcanimicrobiota bacterium]
MKKKLTITLDEQVYYGLHRVVGRGKISQFIEGLVRPHVDAIDLDSSYRELAQFEADHDESSPWIEGVIGDVGELLDDAW